MAEMVKVKDFARNFGLDIKDAVKIIEDSGLNGAAQVGETVELSVINSIVNKMTLGCRTKISEHLNEPKKAEKKRKNILTSCFFQPYFCLIKTVPFHCIHCPIYQFTVCLCKSRYANQ